MKCPKCGFVSYPGLDHCRKCGHTFAAPRQKEASSRFPSISSGPTVTQPPLEEPPEEASPEPKLEEPEGPAPEFPGTEPILSSDETVPELATPPNAGPEQPWQQELSERVENFRRRRAHLQSDEPGENLDLDFGSIEEPDEPVLVEVPETEPVREKIGLDVELEASLAPEHRTASLDAISLEALDSNSQSFAPAHPAREEISLQEPADSRGPVEIVVGPAEASASTRAKEEAERRVPLAPIGRRFLAGLADTLVLLLGAGIFALIFWRAGGHYSPGLLNFAVAGFISVFFIAVYFGLFTDRKSVV